MKTCSLMASLLCLVTTTMLNGNQEHSMPYSYEQAYAKLQEIGQEQLLDSWQALNFKQQQRLLEDVAALDIKAFKEQQLVLSSQSKDSLPQQLESFRAYAYRGSLVDQEVGKKLLYAGKVGVILVAGGQGTRLAYNGPKGTFPISPITKKTLFQLFAEKIVAASHFYGKDLPIAIMTSPQNHAVTQTYFEQHGNFGLKDSQLYFFTQTEKPFLDEDGHLMMQEGTIAKGPDGNGFSLKAFEETGIWEIWAQKGIKYASYILVDNPLSDPFDAELIGFHANQKADMTIKCVEKSSPDERVGVLVNTEHGPQIVEYSEMPLAERQARQADGGLKHRCANIGVFCFDMDFIKKAASYTLPWHLAYKATAIGGEMGWKFETFIFDVMPAASSIRALLYPRAESFAPLKNETGQDSVQTVQAALQKRDRDVLESITGQKISEEEIFELSQAFYYPTEELRQQWHNRTGPFAGYIKP